jgi:hypothetical protein
VTTPENSSSPGMMDMHGKLPWGFQPLLPAAWALESTQLCFCFSSRFVHIPGKG